jgi:hypothetical protein
LNLFQVEREAHGCHGWRGSSDDCDSSSSASHQTTSSRNPCTEVRRYAVVALTNLTFGNANIKSFLCSFQVNISEIFDCLQSFWKLEICTLCNFLAFCLVMCFLGLNLRLVFKYNIGQVYHIAKAVLFLTILSIISYRASSLSWSVSWSLRSRPYARPQLIFSGTWPGRLTRTASRWI